MTSRVSPSLATVALCLGGACAVFVLPWFVPVRGAPVLSDSYMVGFANSVAPLVLWATCCAIALIAARATNPVTVPAPLWNMDAVGERYRLRAVAAAVGVLSLGIAIVLARITAGVAYGETTFFVDRMAQLAAGYRPFTQFSYGYALGGLYGPVWLWRLLRGHGVSPLGAYDAVYAVFLVSSWAMLYVLVSRLRLGDRRRALLFVCLGGVCVVNVTAGVQYTLVRYLAAPAVLLAVHAAGTRAKGGVRPFAMALAALGGLVAVLVFSTPEMELAALAGIACYFVVFGLAERRVAGIAALAFTVGLLPLAALSRGYFALVLSFAGGGLNLPVLPGPPALVYLLAAFIVALLLPLSLRSSPAAERPLTLSLVVVCAALAPAAFGRADSGHIFFNGFLAFVLAAAFLARHRGRFFAPFVVLVLVVFSISGYIDITQLQGPVLLRAVATSGSLTDGQFHALQDVLSWPPGAASRGDQADYVGQKSAASLDRLDQYRRIAAPAGFEEADYDLAFTLAREGRLALDPVPGLGLSQADISKKLAGLSGADCLLLPATDELEIEQADPAKTPTAGWLSGPREHFYGALTLFPFPLYERNAQPNLGGMFSAYIHSHYRLVGSWGEYGVYTPLPSAD